MKSLDAFKSHITKDGFVSQNRYDVFFLKAIANDSNFTSDLKFRCDSLNIPGIQVLTTEYKLYGGQPITKIPNSRAYDDVQMTFLAMGNMKDKYFFEEWIHSISDFSSNSVSYYNTVASNIEIDVYNEVNVERKNPIDANITYGSIGSEIVRFSNFSVDLKPIYTVQLIKAIPTRIESAQVGWADFDTPLKYSVNFSYESIKFLKESNRTNTNFKHLDKTQR
jgi:hypothetical protein